MSPEPGNRRESLDGLTGAPRPPRPPLAWYWHRMRAMSTTELLLHVRKKLRQFVDARRLPDWNVAQLKETQRFPALPKPELADAAWRETLRRDAANILAGRWLAFGHLPLCVDLPPRWHRDYLVERDVPTSAIAFALNHRHLPHGADIKLIWELSRWHPLVRLAMAAYVLGDDRAAQACLNWTADWTMHNPPCLGWNWTSALEAGLRLIQFTWLAALLGKGPGASRHHTALGNLAQQVLPAHAWFVWRHRSFGSSANNHLLGELAGLIIANVRWPALARWSASLRILQQLWESEVLAQFAPDGGNREQALHYHLFSLEFCLQTRAALQTAGCTIETAVEERLARAARFFQEVQMTPDPWDYGDSDDAFVTPLYLSPETALSEWRSWLGHPQQSSPIAFWFQDRPQQKPPPATGQPQATARHGPWQVYPDSGIALCERKPLRLRWDVSPLGHLKPAAHGHLDALHLSIWHHGTALVIDPGTGAYYAAPDLRTWLASRQAHNGPCPGHCDEPGRLGPFLWSCHHPIPRLESIDSQTCRASFCVCGIHISRLIRALPDGQGWEIEDACRRQDQQHNQTEPFTVHWQFAPGTSIKRQTTRRFLVQRAEAVIGMETSADWSEVRLVQAPSQRTASEIPLHGMVSPGFRTTDWAPYLRLLARPGDKPCLFRTTILACAGR